MVIELTQKISIYAHAAVGGKEEYAGPLGKALDYHDQNDRFSQDSWEKAESEMQRIVCNLAMAKAGDEPPQVLLAGDLMNQCTSSSYGLGGFELPFLGLYGACSTCAEGILLASLLCDGSMERAGLVTSSHFCSAERQFRYPLEYGCQKPPTAQHTATASGAFFLRRGEGIAEVKRVCIGRISDGGVTDANNMGAAMAPAAVDTLHRFFRSTETLPSDYDGIFTGDLGYEGHRIVCDLMRELGYDMGKQYTDCGLLLYDRQAQDMHAGGSGCGCSAMVLSTHILPQIAAGKLKNVLFMGTGALMSPSSVQQGLSISGIGHLLHLTKGN
ncbi:MAG: stage V sporulation protein AD [Eubacteriales bacterium]